MASTLIRGDYEVLDFVVMEPDPANPGQERERDITNDTFTFTAKRSPNTDTVTIGPKTVGSGITKSDAVNGEGYVEILPADTSTFTQDTTLYCDIEGVAPINKPYTVVFNVKVKMDISN